MKKFILASICCSVVLLSGCNTIRGVGEDVQSGGHAVSHVATTTQEKI